MLESVIIFKMCYFFFIKVVKLCAVNKLINKLFQTTVLPRVSNKSFFKKQFDLFKEKKNLKIQY